MIAYFIIILAVTARLLPHVPNVAPITALAIFSAATLGWKKSTALTLAVRLASDLFLGFFSWPLMLAVYAAHLAGVPLGAWIAKSRFSWAKTIGASLAAALLFFLVTNFAWLYPAYPRTWEGIGAAYANGLPFFRGTLLGDLGYTVALFGAYRFSLYVKAVQQRPARACA